MLTDQDYVKWFRNSAPYINAHRGRTFVLTFGGEAVDDPNFANIIHDIALLNSLGVRLVLVHGARPQIEQRLQQRGLSTRMHRELRVTDADALACVTDAAGALRAQIEALLSMGLANSPMHGASIRVVSGNFVIAQPLGIVDGVDYGHTGSVRRVDVDGVRRQLAEGNIVLLSSMGYSPTGEVFNLAFEDVANRVSCALSADKLVVFTESGELQDAAGERISDGAPSSLRPLLADDATPAPLRRLIETVVSSVQAGVKRAHIISFREDGALLQELFTRDGAGTLITRDEYERLRTASIDDVGGILEIITPLETQGALVKRSRELLETEIHHFTVMERDGMVVACAALYPYAEQHTGEIACVATHPDYRGADRGERLLAALEAQARRTGLREVFVLTTRTAHWFREQGFVPAGLDALPPGRQALYNYQRNSKVFVKRLG